MQTPEEVLYRAWQPCYRIPETQDLGQRLCVPPFRMVCPFQAISEGYKLQMICQPDYLVIQFKTRQLVSTGGTILEPKI